MDASFQFQVGVFSGGFIPTASNASEWESRWVPAQTAGYSPVTQAFDSSFTVTANPAPFTVGARAYIWGRSQAATQDEWILFRRHDWNWPAPNEMNPLFPVWNAATADEVVLGTLNPGAAPFFMKSETVRSYAQWRNDVLASEPLNGPNDDPDHDGFSNLMEFAFGSSPVQRSAPPAIETTVGSFFQISVPRLRNHLARVTVEVSGDLSRWESGDSHTLEVSNTANLLVVRDLTPIGDGRLMRVKVETGP